MVLGKLGAIYGHNLYTYCCNNPIACIDSTGHAFETIWDIISLAFSVADAYNDPFNPMSWICVACDAVDLLPFVSGVGEVVRTYKAASAASKTVDTIDDAVSVVKKGWKVGDDITALTRSGATPSWSTIRARYWKNKAHYFPELYDGQLDQVKKGLSPMFNDTNGIPYKVELHHFLRRKNELIFLFMEVTPEEHSFLDPFRHLK